ncbi:hypothetical protein [Streptomyces sp. NBC_01276]|uniref:hypothetical protein n=1 Tax=Streptomyces sp. NBC_01276 TaxID=2903808 RepID=UPI00352FDE6F
MPRRRTPALPIATLCAALLAAPARHPDLAPRAHTCTPDWPTTRATWTDGLAPLLR